MKRKEFCGWFLTAAVAMALCGSARQAWAGPAAQATPAIPTPASLTGPAPNSTLGSSATFTWNAGVGVTEYELVLGTIAPGTDNLGYFGGPSVFSDTASLPTNGVTVFARLYSLISGVWQWNDYTFTEGGALVLAALTSPTPGTVLPNTSVTFTWTAGSGPSGYWLYLGTTGVGSTNLYNSGATTATSATVTGLPTNGTTVYAKFLQRIDGAWQTSYYTYSFIAAAPKLDGAVLDQSLLAGAGWVRHIGRYAYVTGDSTQFSGSPTASNNLCVIDTQASGGPALMGCTPPSPYMVGAEGLECQYPNFYVVSYLYVAVVNVSNANAPAVIGYLRTSSSTYENSAMALNGNVMYIASYYDGGWSPAWDAVCSIDISDYTATTANPKMIECINNVVFEGTEELVYENGNLFGIGVEHSGTEAFWEVDASNPAAMSLTGADTTHGIDSYFWLGDRDAFAPCTVSGIASLCTLDISNMASGVTVLGSTPAPSTSGFGWVLKGAWPYLYIDSNSADTLWTYDLLTNYPNPTLVPGATVTDTTNLQGVDDMDINGGELCVTLDYGGVTGGISCWGIGGLDVTAAKI